MKLEQLPPIGWNRSRFHPIGRCSGEPSGSWRWIYVGSATLALYLNVFVGVVQAFQKLSFLKPLAPTQSEPPFLIAQTIVLVLFLLGIVAVRRFHAGAAVR